MFWCSLVGANRPPNQAIPVARQEKLSLCVLWSLSLSESFNDWGEGDVTNLSPFWERTAQNYPLPETYLINLLVK